MEIKDKKIGERFVIEFRWTGRQMEPCIKLEPTGLPDLERLRVARVTAVQAFGEPVVQEFVYYRVLRGETCILLLGHGHGYAQPIKLGSAVEGDDFWRFSPDTLETLSAELCLLEGCEATSDSGAGLRLFGEANYG